MAIVDAVAVQSLYLDLVAVSEYQFANIENLRASVENLRANLEAQIDALRKLFDKTAPNDRSKSALGSGSSCLRYAARAVLKIGRESSNRWRRIPTQQ